MNSTAYIKQIKVTQQRTLKWHSVLFQLSLLLILSTVQSKQLSLVVSDFTGVGNRQSWRPFHADRIFYWETKWEIWQTTLTILYLMSVVLYGYIPTQIVYSNALTIASFVSMLIRTSARAASSETPPSSDWAFSRFIFAACTKDTAFLTFGSHSLESWHWCIGRQFNL